jgi:V8-like Glu-specific endopeptidase
MRGLCLIASVLPLLLAACAPAKSRHHQDLGQEKTPSLIVEVPKVITAAEPPQLEVICGESKCPPQVGLLVFYGEPNKEGFREIDICTSFLISADSIMSNGHCDRFGQMPGFFVGQTVNGQKNVRAIVGVTYKRYTVTKDGRQMRKPDVAIYKLEKPIASMPALRLASGPQPDFKTLTAYSIFVGDQPNQFKILSRQCKIHRHEAYFPFSLSEAPDMIESFDCEMIKGNSGSPMFAPGSDEVQAVHAGNTPIAGKEAQEKRKLLSFELHTDSIATNVRCLDYPGAKPISCTPADFTAAADRWKATQNFEIDKLLKREFPNSQSYPVKFRVIRQQIQITSPILEFELIYLPKCRIKDVSSTSMPVVFERVRLVPDEWAVMKVEAEPVNAVTMGLRQLSGNVYRLTTDWPAAPADLLDPENDIRKRAPGAFNIDLPVCPR